MTANIARDSSMNFDEEELAEFKAVKADYCGTKVSLATMRNYGKE
jgi:hypothetical protein